MSLRPAAKIAPQLLPSGIPTPNSDSEPSATMTTPTAKKAIAMTAGRTFGTMCFHKMVEFLAPIDFAAVTNSRFDHDKVAPRAMRPKIGMMTIVSAKMTTNTLRQSETVEFTSGAVASTATRASANTKLGIERTALKTMLTTASIFPRTYPERMPMRLPMAPPTPTATTATNKVSRVPWSNSRKRSYPLLLVPNRWPFVNGPTPRSFS